MSGKSLRKLNRTNARTYVLFCCYRMCLIRKISFCFYVFCSQNAITHDQTWGIFSCERFLMFWFSWSRSYCVGMCPKCNGVQIGVQFISPSLTVLPLYYRHARACLKVSAKNSLALLFISRGKEGERKTTTISCFSPAEEELSRGIFGGNFQTRMHGSNKAAGLKVTTCQNWCAFVI